MATELLSILLLGDSHVGGFQAQTYDLTVAETGREIAAMIRPVSLGGAYIALDSTVTFPDGRVGVSPLLYAALGSWSGLGVKGRPLSPVDRVSKHLVLSL